MVCVYFDCGFCCPLCGLVFVCKLAVDFFGPFCGMVFVGTLTVETFQIFWGFCFGQSPLERFLFNCF